MIVGIYLLSVLFFCIAFYFTKLVPTALDTISISRQAIDTIADSQLNDMEKEKAVQKAAIGMIKNCGLLLIKGGVTFGIALLPIFLADQMKLVSMSASSEFALRWDVLLITTVVLMGAVMAWNSLRRNKT